MHNRHGVPMRTSGIEKAFVVIVILLSLGAFENLWVTGPIETQNMGMVGMQVLWSFLYCVTFIFFYRACNRIFRELLFVYPLLVLIAFASFSVFWSDAPALTIRRSIALALTLMFGVYFSSRFNVKEQFRLLSLSFTISIIFSFFFELLGFNPSEGIPGWYGVFFHKTELGRNMALAGLVFLFWGKVEPEKKISALLGFFASAVLVLLSQDMTSLTTFIFLLLTLPYLQKVLRLRLNRAIAGFAFFSVTGIFLGVYIFKNLETVTGLLGKDPMLTGRLPLWILSVVMAAQRPWLGYGLSAFWLPDEIYTQRIWHVLGWMPPHAHNGILELWLELGIIGTTLFLLIFGRYVIKAIKFLRQNSQPFAAWPLIFLIFFFITNLTESFFVTPNTIYFLLYVVCAMMLCGNSFVAELNLSVAHQ